MLKAIVSAVSVLLVFALALSAAPAHAAKEEPWVAHTYLLPGHGAMQISAPVSWKDRYEVSQDGKRHTLVLVPETGSAFQLIVSPQWGTPASPLYMPDEAKLNQMVQRLLDAARPDSVEFLVKIEEIKAEGLTGYYFTVTGRKYVDGFKYTTRGALRMGDVLVDFTLRVADRNEAVINKAIKALATLNHGCRYLQQSAAETALSVGELSWAMRFPSQGWTLLTRTTAADGLGAQYSFESAGRGLRMDVTLARAVKCASSRACQDRLWMSIRGGYAGAKEIRIIESGEFAGIKFTTKDRAVLMAAAYKDGYELDVIFSGQGQDLGKMQAALSEALSKVTLK